jgi:hypothetical protein
MGERPFLFEVNPIEAMDIDTEYDLLIADLYLRTQVEKATEAARVTGLSAKENTTVAP